MKFLLAALPHNAHLQNIALALYEADALGAYYSGAVDNYRHAWGRSARKTIGAAMPGLVRRLQRRRVTTVPAECVYPQRFWDGLTTLAGVLTSDRNLQDRLWEHSEFRFDHRSARLIQKPEFGGYFGVEHGALETAQAARRLGKPIVIGFLSPHHDTLKDCVLREYSDYPELVTPYVEQLQRLEPQRTARKNEEARLADVIHTASKFTANSLAEHAGVDRRRIITIPLGGPDPISSSSLPASGGPRVRFMYSGHVSVQKGVHYLLQAWDLLDCGSHASLHVFGSMRLPETVWTNHKRSFTYHGQVPEAALLGEYEKASILVFPTLCDGFGMVVQEALSRGVPVITTTHAGAAELIEDGKNGFVVPPRDPYALAERMRWCVDHPTEVWRMRTAALETAKTWTWERFRVSLRDQLAISLGVGWERLSIEQIRNESVAVAVSSR